jgi:hypothetical protein
MAKVIHGIGDFYTTVQDPLIKVHLEIGDEIDTFDSVVKLAEDFL